jgi:large subunit ribosomal protein L28
MSRICCVCGKKPQVANLVSHANNRVKRWVYPNVQKMRYSLSNAPSVKVYQGTVCSKCVKAKKVLKVL